MEQIPAGGTATPRLKSIDALRGFDMFWIMGGDSLFRAVGTWLDQPALVTQLKHVDWEGFRFYDLIFPLFLFIVGAVLPFSLAKYRDSGPGNSGAYFRILRRAALLIAFGLIYNQFLQLNFTEFRWPGVLQRIGLCYFFAALVVLHLGVRGQTLLAAGLLGGYWALLRFVAAPGFAAFDLTKEGNLVAYVDRLVIPGKLFYGFGALAGHWLMSQRSPHIKCIGLFASAALCLAAGYGWNASFPIIKILWTSSYVLVAGGYSLALLGLFYLVIDVLGWQRWAFFFTVIGMNPITIYMMSKFVDFRKMGEFFVGGLAAYTSAEVYTMILALAVVTARWLVLLYLYRNKTFLRV
jgi:predicted acyltransferase